MNIQIFKDNATMSDHLAKRIATLIQEKPDSLICLAGGETPKQLFKSLIHLAQQQAVSFSQCFFVSLDEWVGLDESTKGSCIQTLRDYFFDPLSIDMQKQVAFFNGKALSLHDECERIHHFITHHQGIDIMVLGVGMNGHIGFIEPNADDDTYCSIVNLDPITQQVSSKYFGQQLPLQQGITLGVKHMLAAKHLVLMASGGGKADIIKQTCESPISKSIPSSLIRKSAHACLYLDEAAAAKLSPRKIHNFI